MVLNHKEMISSHEKNQPLISNIRKKLEPLENEIIKKNSNPLVEINISNYKEGAIKYKEKTIKVSDGLIKTLDFVLNQCIDNKTYNCEQFILSTQKGDTSWIINKSKYDKIDNGYLGSADNYFQGFKTPKQIHFEKIFDTSRSQDYLPLNFPLNEVKVGDIIVIGLCYTEECRGEHVLIMIDENLCISKFGKEGVFIGGLEETLNAYKKSWFQEGDGPIMSPKNEILLKTTGTVKEK